MHALKAIKAAGVSVHACSHITGGGFYENVPRMLPDGMHATIQKSSYPVPPLFSLLQRQGQIAEREMYATYNMGIGMVLAVHPNDTDAAMAAIRSAGDTPYVIGEVRTGEKGVTVC